MSKKIKMLRPGKFQPDPNGPVIVLSEADVAEAAATYNPAIYAAGLTKGHPAHDEPRFGDIWGVEVKDGILLGETANVDPVFRQEVNSGRYPYGSIALYGRKNPNNPTPGKLYIKHFGLFGAVPPVIKDLGRIELSEDSGGEIITVYTKLEFGEYQDRVLVRVLRNLKNTLIGEWGKEKADATIDEWDLQMLTEEAARPDPPADISPEPAFAENNKGGPMDPKLKEEMDRRSADLDSREKVLLKQENDRKHGDNLAFAEALVADGKQPASKKAAIVAALDFAAGITEGGTIEFGEGDAKTTQAPLDIFKSILETGPKIIEFGEMGGGDSPAGGKETVIPAKITDCV